MAEPVRPSLTRQNNQPARVEQDLLLHSCWSDDSETAAVVLTRRKLVQEDCDLGVAFPRAPGHPAPDCHLDGQPCHQ